MKQIYLALFFATGFCSLLYSQQIVNVEFLDRLSIFETRVYIGFGSVDVKNGCEIYKVLYTTPDQEGIKDTASGFMAIPVDVAGPHPMVLYQHGTSSPNDVPSNEIESSSAVYYASQGYISLAPDYIGMGESRGFHPYVHAATEASAAIDMILACKDWMVQNGIGHNGQLFITGYSQGGHAAMAAFKVLEESYSDVLPVCGVAPMSGPYDLSDTQANFALTTNRNYCCPVFLPYIIIGYKQVYPDLYDKLTDVFKPSFATIANRFLSEQYDDGSIDIFNINNQLIQKLFQEAGGIYTKSMFTASFLTQFESNPDFAMNVRLRENNLYDWTPNAPLRMYYCTGDEQVNFNNSLVADTVMNNRGAEDVAAVNVGSGLTHGQCVEPAFAATLAFFDSLRVVCQTSPVASIPAESMRMNIYPNPFSEIVFFEFENKASEYVELKIFNSLGVLIATPFSDTLPAGYQHISWQTKQNPAATLYFYQLQIGDKTINGSIQAVSP